MGDKKQFLFEIKNSFSVIRQKFLTIFALFVYFIFICFIIKILYVLGIFILNKNFIGGTDAFAEIPWGEYLYEVFKKYHFFYMWSEQWYLGYSTITVFSPIYAFFIFLFKCIGINPILGLKTLFLISLFLSFVGMFCLARYMGLNRLASSTIGLLYTLAPHHLGEVYLEGHALMDLNYGLAPFLFLFLFKVCKNSINVLEAIFYGFVTFIFLLCHPQAAFFLVFPLAFIILLLYIFVYPFSKDNIILNTKKLYIVILSIFFVLVINYLPLILNQGVYIRKLSECWKGEFSNELINAFSLRVLTGRYKNGWISLNFINYVTYYIFLTIALFFFFLKRKMYRDYKFYLFLLFLFTLYLNLSCGSNIFPNLFSMLYYTVPPFRSIRTPDRFTFPALITFCLILILVFRNLEIFKNKLVNISLMILILMGSYNEFNVAFTVPNLEMRTLKIAQFYLKYINSGVHSNNNPVYISTFPSVTWYKLSRQEAIASKQNVILNPFYMFESLNIISIGGLSPAKCLRTNKLSRMLDGCSTSNCAKVLVSSSKFLRNLTCIIEKSSLKTIYKKNDYFILKNFNVKKMSFSSYLSLTFENNLSHIFIN